MQLAVEKAWKYQLLTYPNPAVGAVVVRNNEVLSIEAHKEAGKPHAEVLALQAAFLTQYPQSTLKDLENAHDIHIFLCANHQDFFKECEIYVTLEPCNHSGKTPACASLLRSVGIKKVFIGTLDSHKKASGGVQTLREAGICVETGINQTQTDRLLYPFECFQKGHFSFFKMAMREDGSIDGGYITTQKSLQLVHKIRTKITCMVIGGNTVRTDRPTLDARFAPINIPPNIWIYSHKTIFDTSIALFGVPNREVIITQDSNAWKEDPFVMIEGGYTLLESMLENIDYLMVFISHKQKSKKQKTFDETLFEKQHAYFLNEHDEVIFYKRIKQN